MVDLKYNNN